MIRKGSCIANVKANKQTCLEPRTATLNSPLSSLYLSVLYTRVDLRIILIHTIDVIPRLLSPYVPLPSKPCTSRCIIRA